MYVSQRLFKSMQRLTVNHATSIGVRVTYHHAPIGLCLGPSTPSAGAPLPAP